MTYPYRVVRLEKTFRYFMNYPLPPGYQVLVDMSAENREKMLALVGHTDFSCLATFAEIPKQGQRVILSNNGPLHRLFKVETVILKNVEKEGYLGDALGIDWTTFYPDQVHWACMEVSFIKEFQFHI